jgi:hypothetical protein
MKITIRKSPDKRFTPFVNRALNFYANSLGISKKILKNVEIVVKFNAKLDVWALASIEGVNSKNEPREFLIEIHPGITARQILQTLAHEMVHIKQYINKEIDDQLNSWKGIDIPEETDYYSAPWEVEAHGVEIGLTMNFSEQERLWEVFEGFPDPNGKIIGSELGWKL